MKQIEQKKTETKKITKTKRVSPLCSVFTTTYEWNQVEKLNQIIWFALVGTSFNTLFDGWETFFRSFVSSCSCVWLLQPVRWPKSTEKNSKFGAKIKDIVFPIRDFLNSIQFNSSRFGIWIENKKIRWQFPNCSLLLQMQMYSVWCLWFLLLLHFFFHLRSSLCSRFAFFTQLHLLVLICKLVKRSEV